MKIKSALVTQMSGSIGGLTGSRNRGGMYIRSRAIPTNPTTGPQTAVRNVFGAMSAAWSSVLSPAQRAAWDLYASNVPVTDRLGDSIYLSGQQWFVGANTLRIRSGFAFIADGPTTFSRPSFTTPTSLSLGTDGSIGFAYTATDDWANEAGGALICFAGKPVSRGINFFKGPFRFCDTVDGDDTTPPTSPASLDSPFVQSIDQHVWLRFVAILADGRFSPAAVLGPEQPEA